jgi:hypothetical protein
MVLGCRTVVLDGSRMQQIASIPAVYDVSILLRTLDAMLSWIHSSKCPTCTALDCVTREHRTVLLYAEEDSICDRAKATLSSTYSVTAA